MLKLAITGCTGRMGQITLHEANQDPAVEVISALTRPGSPFVGQDIGNLIGEGPFNILITDSPEIAFAEADVVIDFSHPDALERNLGAIVNLKKPYIVCMTGLSNLQSEALEKASHVVPLLIAPNTSIGIAVLKKLAHMTAEALGPSYDISILEMHHRHKADAPSGTSLSIAKALTNLDHLKQSIPPYPSLSPRPTSTIECAVLRGGNVIGDHSVVFAGEKDVITLEHRALDKALFAQGAIKAAQWIFERKSGLYSMDDVVGTLL